ncbi:MAG: N-acetylmuramoyl-L-alanine amidase-like domain-containing protein [Flavobacteriaceae bacterium]
MRYIFTLITVLQFTIDSNAQQISFTEEDRQAYEQKIAQIQSLDDPEMGKTVVAVGNSFSGTPYIAQSLEINEEERLVINLRAFDCTTYVENVLAFTLLLKKEEMDFNAFTSVLQNIRYRDGEISGYASRLNYFSEWLYNNEAKGLVKNITSEIGGLPLHKEINFMSSHRDLYPMLEEKSSYDRIMATEVYLSQKTMSYLPREQVRKSESLIKDGDIIALATSIDGLDVTHTGFAIRKSNDRIYLLHASASGKVEISKKPLSEYLKGIKSNTGIIVARPQ